MYNGNHYGEVIDQTRADEMVIHNLIDALNSRDIIGLNEDEAKKIERAVKLHLLKNCKRIIERLDESNNDTLKR